MDNISITSKEIFKIVSSYFSVDLTVKSQAMDSVIPKSIANKLSKILTKESLREIGNNTNKTHAAVINSIRRFDRTYIKKKLPFNVKKEYEYLLEYIEHYIMSDKNPIEMKNFIGLPEKYTELKINHDITAFSLKNTINELKEFTANRDIPDYLESIISELKELTAEEVIEFSETRLKPFKLNIANRKMTYK